MLFDLSDGGLSLLYPLFDIILILIISFRAARFNEVGRTQFNPLGTKVLSLITISNEDLLRDPMV